MLGLNKVILIGNLGKDPDVRRLDNGTVVASFPLATTEGYRDKEGTKKEQTEWHNIVLWRGLAEIGEKYLKKGSTVYVEGKLRTRLWTDKDGNKRYTTEIQASNMIVVNGRKGDNGDARTEVTANTVETTVEDFAPPTDVLPF